MKSLRSVQVTNADGPDKKQLDYGVVSGNVEAVFFRHGERLASLLHEHRHGFAFGCVAWLTNQDILAALGRVHCAQIVVQKEDFLRPDGGGTAWKRNLRQAYGRLTCTDRFCLPGLAGELSVCGDTTVAGVRCAGVLRRGETAPRMHHKFLVVGGVADADCPDEDRTATGWEPVFEPAAVWTGSFNFTNNGGDSIENAVIIHDPVIATAYLNEWAQVFALSEPLDWESEYIAPEWRIGT